jgi:dienelactone hydrolase
MFVTPYSLPPFDRSETNGIRCSRPLAAGRTQTADVGLRAPVAISSRHYRTITPVSNEVYDIFRRQLSYSRGLLNAHVDARDESGTDAVRETISFDTGYEQGRTTVHLFLPRSARPPYQAVVVFPALGAFLRRAPSDTFNVALDYVLKSGRAFAIPVYKGAFERWDPFLSLEGDEYLRTFRARMSQWRQDVGRVIDVLSSRSDIDAQRVAYLGQSFGASTPIPLLALEERFKAAVLLGGGLPYRALPPEADAVNYLSHVMVPVLLVGGRYDYLFPLESSQRPLFERLGTKPEDKRHVIFDAGHTQTFPRSELIREVLGWLDKYLGPVSTPTTQ